MSCRFSAGARERGMLLLRGLPSPSTVRCIAVQQPAAVHAAAAHPCAKKRTVGRTTRTARGVTRCAAVQQPAAVHAAAAHPCAKKRTVGRTTRTARGVTRVGTVPAAMTSPYQTTMTTTTPTAVHAVIQQPDAYSNAQPHTPLRTSHQLTSKKQSGGVIGRNATPHTPVTRTRVVVLG